MFAKFFTFQHFFKNKADGLLPWKFRSSLNRREMRKKKKN